MNKIPNLGSYGYVPPNLPVPFQKPVKLWPFILVGLGLILLFFLLVYFLFPTKKKQARNTKSSALFRSPFPKEDRSN